MKLLYLVFSFCLFMNPPDLCSQNYPVIGAYTVIPTNYSSQVVPTKIVTKTMIVNQGQHLGTSFTINYSSFPKKIELKGCYFDGQILPATQTFVDTFYVGILPVGTYTVSFKAYLSSSSSSCIPVDSNSISFFHDVPIVESLHEWDLAGNLDVYPNPGRDEIFLPDNLQFTSLFISDLTGNYFSVKKFNGQGICIDELKDGLYVLLIRSPDKMYSIRFIKLSEN